jgi:hypothetical protein
VSIETIKESHSDQRQGIKAAQTSIKDKEQKVLVVANAHAIVDPGTVVWKMLRKRYETDILNLNKSHDLVFAHLRSILMMHRRQIEQ